MKNIIKIVILTLSLLTYKNHIYACTNTIYCSGDFSIDVKPEDKNIFFTSIGSKNKTLKKGGLILGNESVAGENTTIVGRKNIVKGDNNHVLGSNITEDETVKNSIILGNGSKGESNTLSIGSKGNERRIINVSKAIKDTDAVNFAQLKEYVKNSADTSIIREELKKHNSDLSAGIALSMAMSAIPQVGQSKLVSIGFGSSYYNKQAGFALGISGTETRNIFVYKLNVGIDTRKNFGVSAGFNINFVNKASNVKISNNNIYNDKLRQLDEKLNKISLLEKELENLIYPKDFILSGFGINKSNLTDIQKQILINIISKININTKIKTLKIVGYADTRGDDKYNLELGLRRARNVADELYNLGLNRNIKVNVFSTGFNTIIENGLESSNRRVEIKAY